jgi:hypothetical protein
MPNPTATASRSRGYRTADWEYRAIHLDAADRGLDCLGDGGWELVSFTTHYAYFKRPTNVGPHARRR